MKAALIVLLMLVGKMHSSLAQDVDGDSIASFNLMKRKFEAHLSNPGDTFGYGVTIWKSKKQNGIRLFLDNPLADSLEYWDILHVPVNNSVIEGQYKIIKKQMKKMRRMGFFRRLKRHRKYYGRRGNAGSSEAYLQPVPSFFFAVPKSISFFGIGGRNISVSSYMNSSKRNAKARKKAQLIIEETVHDILELKRTQPELFFNYKQPRFVVEI